MNKKNESGRSMVEMLGVLAVMGVLSVGGVAMYTSAMNKYRANEILNEASKRAVMVAGQLLTNPNATTMSLAQFGSNAVAGATFGENAAISNGKITLTVSGVKTAVCNQMIAATGTNSAMQVASGCGTITFNADMSKGGNNIGESEQQEPVTNLCDGYDAQCCDNGDITGTGACDYNGGTNNGICNAGKCEEAPQECDIKIRNIYDESGGKGSVNFYYSFDNGVSWKEIDKTKTGVLGASSQIKFKIVRSKNPITREGICGVDDGSCNLDIPYGDAPDFILKSVRGTIESENLLVDPKDCDSTAIFSILITEDD